MTDLRSRLEAALGTTYRIERELGGGGMSHVFLADEVELGRQVVIKVLPPEMAASVNQDRFRREIHLAAQLQHPHIVPLLTAGAAGDLLYYVMPFIRGESLRARLAREGELPVPETIRILREVTDALNYAHGEGVVHRDIKPDNVMISGHHALVTDFGVAKAVTASSGSGSITSLGMALGTPAYMAPEQAAGDPHVDHRADLYALGAMAYEMLAGRPPFTAPTPQALLAAQVTQTPDRVSAHRSSVPPGLETLVMRCLEKKPADRWQQAGELLPNLEALLTPSSAITPTDAVPAISSGTRTALRKTRPLRVGFLFALAALAVWSASWWLMLRLGLPGWVVTVAGILLLIGFPIILLTAERERRRLQARTRGQVVPPPQGLLGRLFTWKGALAGGGLAFAGLAAGSAAFMVLRLAGVGPFATLVSAGVLKDRDRLIVADFENRTGDSTLAASITEAFRIDLSQSSVVRLVDPGDLAAALTRMERGPGGALSADVAREVAEREGAKAVVAGEIAPLASGFVLSVRLLNPADGAVLLAGREIANDLQGVIPAVEQLSRKLREGIGESLRSIRAGPPLESVTTTSLAALRLYTLAERAADSSQYGESLRYLDQAIALDSGFAMAWRKVAVVATNMGGNFARQLEAATRAYQLRDRLPALEGALAEAYYFGTLNDRPRSIAAYEKALTIRSDNPAARNNLAILYNALGRYPAAERLLQGPVDSGTTVGVMYANLLSARMAQRKWAEAESTLTRYARVLPRSQERLAIGATLAWSRGQWDRALAAGDTLSRSEDQYWSTAGFGVRSTTFQWVGRLRESDAALGRQLELLDRQRVGVAYLQRVSEVATADVWVRNQPATAIHRLDAALARYPLDSIARESRPYARLAAAYAAAGRPDRAEMLLAEEARVIPEVLRRNSEWEYFARGMLALEQQKPRDALPLLRKGQELAGCRVCGSTEIARAFEALGQPDSALAAYEAFATLPGDFAEGREYQMTWVLQRLGELYTSKGDTTRAVEYYRRYADLWRNADPELQPRVSDVKRRLAGLVGEPKG